MSLLPDGFAFFRGLGIGLLGAILWVLASLVQGVLTGLGDGGSPVLFAFMIVGYGLMFLGPLWYWIGRPVYYWRRSE